MQQITFNMKTLHLYGTAFYDFLRLRKRYFVDELGWDIPHDDEVEMDQYDNPLAWYSLVLDGGRVVGGARTMATTAAWGEHTYMLRDAVQGKLADIPADIMGGEVANARVWECTRLIISDAVKGHAERSLCLSLIVDGLVDVAAAAGAARLISLSPLPLMRALRQLGFGAERIGEPYRNDDGRLYAVLAMPACAETAGALRATHRPRAAMVHAAAAA